MSDDSDIESKSGKNSVRPLKAASSPENADCSSPITSLQPSWNQLIASNEETSESEDEEIIKVLPPGRRLPRILSDGESGDIEVSDLFTDTSDDSSDDEDQPKSGVTNNKIEEDGALHGSSSDSDGQSDKCPICLAKISMQEIGTPESCDHCFCVDCIQEWSKNVNTCPVDRQPFTLILVREHIEGKVTRQIPVNSPTERPEEESGDVTFCEVCGQSDREDRMLLCDACDLGYHMECLQPPLHYVPIDEWYCPDCTPSRAMERVEEVGENLTRVNDGRRTTRTRPAPRLLPRTSQSERVQSTVRRHRPNQASSSTRGVMFGERTQSSTTKRKVRKRKPKRRLKTRIKRIYTDDGVVEVLVKKKKYGKKRTKRTVCAKPKSVKGRLATRLGMCAPRLNKQFLPDTQSRSEETSTSLQNQRHRAGVPTLDIFGRRDQLEYFSGSDNEEGEIEERGGVGLISRVSVARPRDRFITRKKAASVLSVNSLRKPVKLETVSSPANGSLLDSILDSQALWHSKKAEIKSKPDGSVQVILPKSNTNRVVREEGKIDVRNTTAPVIETPLFPGAANSGNFKPNSFTTSNNGQDGNRSTSEQSYEGSQESSTPSTSTGAGGANNNSSGGGPSPLRGIAPIRFRMNAPPKRPNIHSYPTDNIPPPPPLRLKLPAVEESFPSTNSPEPSPPREDEEIDIYSDIEQEDEKSEEKTFGALEPPPEPTFLMTMSMDPPPEPPALLMNLNEDASDDEPTGLVIDDLPPASDVYDPCAVNSDESSAEGFPLAKPPEIPLALKDPGLVADYSSDSFSSPYNPERPTYSGKRMIGPLPRPASHRSSSESEEDCPNFSMYSTTSMNIALRGLPSTRESLDIPIPPPLPKQEPTQPSIDIPLPDSEPPSPNKENTLDIPIPEDKECEHTTDVEEETTTDKQICQAKESDHNDEGSLKENYSNEETDNEDDDEDDNKIVVNDKVDGDNEDNDENKGEMESGEVDSTDEKEDNLSLIKNIKTKRSTESAEDECSTQGDVLDLAIESEANLENNIPPGSAVGSSEKDPSKSPLDLEENDDEAGDGGDKSDGLVDITDEDMSVYDGQENRDDIDQLDEHLLSISRRDQKDDQSLDSDDDNSLVGGATSAVSAGTLNNSDTVQPPTLPGLEGLETETISESEDVNFDELPIDNNDLSETLRGEEDHSSTKKKKRKKTRKISHSEDVVSKTSNEPLEFEEGEIIEDKPKQVAKKDKKLKSKSDSNVEVEEMIESNKPKTPILEKEIVEKKTKKKKDKSSVNKDKTKDIKEKTLKPGQADENISWKKLSKSTKERNYRDAKEKEDKSKTNDNREKEESLSKKEKRGREKRKEMERYNVRRLISEKPKQPKKDEFGRDISPSKSGSSLSPYRPPRYRSPLRTKNRTRSRSKSLRSRSRSKDRKKRSRSRGRVPSRDRSRNARSRDRSRRSLSRNKVSSRSRERRRSPAKKRSDKRRSTSRVRKRTRSRSAHSKRRTSPSYSKSWSPSLSRSSRSRSRYRGKRKSKSRSRSKSVPQSRSNPAKDPPKNLTVIVTNKEALKKKEKKKPTKKKDDRRKRKKGQSPAPSKEVFTSGDNILVSVNFKNSNKNPELIPATTPLLKESSKRKRDDTDGSAKKKKPNSTKKGPGAKKSSRLSKINEAAKNAKPVAIIDLDLSPFREQTPSPKEVIVLSDSGDEEDKHHSQNENVNDRLGHNGMSQNVMSLSSQQKNSMAQPESPLSSNYIMNSSGPKTPPEPHIKFSISTKPSQMRILNNPLMDVEEEMHDDNGEPDMNEILHKGPNTPPDPPPDLHTPASPPTTPYDPFDPTKSRSPSPQPRNGDTGSLNTSREDKLDGVQNEDNVDHGNAGELRTSTPPLESDDAKKTPDTVKVHSTPKTDPNNVESSPKVSPPSGAIESGKLSEDLLTKPIQKLLAGASKADITVHKSPDKVITVVINQQTKSQTPKQAAQPMKTTTPNKNQVSKGSTKHQLFSSSIVKQVPILGALLPLPYVPMNINNSSKSLNRSQQNGDPSDDMDIDPSSPYSPGSSEGDDLFEPPIATPPRNSKPLAKPKNSTNKFDALFGSSPANKLKHGRHGGKISKKGSKTKNKGNKKEEVKVKLDEDQLKILDDLPSSAVEMQVKDKFLKKLNRQERVVEEVKLVLKPHYVKKHVTKEEYKEILRRSVPKICHNKSGEINPIKIQFLVEAYVKKFRYAKKKSSGNMSAPAQNKPKPQKTLWS